VLIEFRPLEVDDFDVLAAWLVTPHVYEWWMEEFELPKYAAMVDGTDETHTEGFVVVADGRPIGFIQRYRHADDPEWDAVVGIPNAAGIDYLIGERSYVGRGVGTAVIDAFTPAVFARYPEIDVVIAAPQVANRASCRALEKAGYELAFTGDLPDEPGESAVYVRAR
jgi:aminoglycoside 6'-N-acetyltransferase